MELLPPSLVVSLTFPCTTGTALVFSNPHRRWGNKILFSQEMVSRVYLNESAVVCCFTPAVSTQIKELTQDPRSDLALQASHAVLVFDMQTKNP